MNGLTTVSHGRTAQVRDIYGTESDAELAAEALPAGLLKSLKENAPNSAGCHVAPGETRKGDALDWRAYEHLALVAHELRGSLGTIRSAAWLMQMRGRTPDVAKDAELILDRQVHQMSRLIEDLLEGSQVRTGRLRLHPGRL